MVGAVAGAGAASPDPAAGAVGAVVRGDLGAVFGVFVPAVLDVVGGAPLALGADAGAAPAVAAVVAAARNAAARVAWSACALAAACAWVATN